jgi:hypothetical protein
MVFIGPCTQSPPPRPSPVKGEGEDSGGVLTK